MKRLLLQIIKLYRNLFSPCFPHSCRFYPSCSAYAMEAIEAHGVLTGLLLGLGRILRCNPYLSFGYDPVPRRDSGFHVKHFNKRGR